LSQPPVQRGWKVPKFASVSAITGVPSSLTRRRPCSSRGEGERADHARRLPHLVLDADVAEETLRQDDRVDARGELVDPVAVLAVVEGARPVRPRACLIGVTLTSASKPRLLTRPALIVWLLKPEVGEMATEKIWLVVRRYSTCRRARRGPRRSSARGRPRRSA
jgi:hypothetical protein